MRTDKGERMRLSVSLRVTAVVATLLMAGSAMAGVVTRHYEFSEPLITPEGDYHRITMTDAWNYGDPGEPVLPLAAPDAVSPSPFSPFTPTSKEPISKPCSSRLSSSMLSLLSMRSFTA